MSRAKMDTTAELGSNLGDIMRGCYRELHQMLDSSRPYGHWLISSSGNLSLSKGSRLHGHLCIFVIFPVFGVLSYFHSCGGLLENHRFYVN